MDVQNFKPYLLRIKKMREAQREFFTASARRDFEAKKRILPQAKALEKKVDEETDQLLHLMDQNFNPELFR